MDELSAQRLFQAAINEGKCGALFDALVGDGAATVDAMTGKLVIIDGDMFKGMWGND